ncbi:unnamed protein product [Calypogeia fissa]
MTQMERNQSIERTMSKIHPCSYIVFRFLLSGILALASVISLVYPLSVEDDVQIWPKQSPTIRQQDAIDDDYTLWVSENKLASLNETFLAYAAIDTNEKQEKVAIKFLLEETRGVSLNPLNIQKYRRARFYLGQGRKVVMPNWMIQIQSPKYDVYWPRFRQLLQAWSRKRRHNSLMVKKFLGNMKMTLDKFYNMPGFPQGPIANDEKFERYKSCAVVGNSGVLLTNKSFASLIDNHDFVIRLNNAKVRGFEDYVGSKTSLSFVNSNVYQACSLKKDCFCHPYGKIPIVLYLCQVQHLLDVAYCEPSNESPVIVTDPGFDALCTRLIKWYSLKNYVKVTGNPMQSWAKNHTGIDFHYSSGLQAVVLALGICKKVDMFGFGKASKASHHYHTARRAELSLHDYVAEYHFYEDLTLNRTSSIPFLSEAGMQLPPVTINF